VHVLEEARVVLHGNLARGGLAGWVRELHGEAEDPGHVRGGVDCRCGGGGVGRRCRGREAGRPRLGRAIGCPGLRLLRGGDAGGRDCG
jgi:hypothetical protein